MQRLAVERFGGLNLYDDPIEVGLGGAIDLLNVDLDGDGRLSARAGYVQVDSSGGTATYYRVFPVDGAYLALFRNSGVNIAFDKMVGSTISNVGSWAGGTSPQWTSSAVLGTPTSTILFIATAEADATNNGLRQYDGTTLAAAAGSPRFVAVSPWDNRLVQAHYTSAAGSPSGANGSTSTVFFSDAGAPNTYTATNFLHLTPGDGEQIVGITRWRDLLFVFKSSSVFVFYGVSVGATGQPIFNYRRIGIPATVAYQRGYEPIVAGPDGVYFHTREGIYRTTGGIPELVSKPILPAVQFAADAGMLDASLSFSSLTLGVNLGWARERLFVRFTNANNAERAYVLDRRSGQWVLWSAAGLANFVEHTAAFGGRASVYTAGSSHAYAFSDNMTSDAGVAIVSHYKSGYAALAEGDQARVRPFHLTGSGTVTHSLQKLDATDQLAADVSVAMGVAPAVLEKRAEQSAMARYLGFKVSAASGAWALNRWRATVNSARKRG